MKNTFKFILCVLLMCVCANMANAQSALISTYAGSALAGLSGDAGPATICELNGPNNVMVDPSGNLFISDATNNRVRMVNTAGVIIEIAGNGSATWAGDGGPATLASLNNPSGFAMDAAGNLYVGDQFNHVIRKISPAVGGIITTIAGQHGVSGFGGEGGPASAATFNRPYQMSFDSHGNLYMVDQYNHCIRKITATSGTITGSEIITTFAGHGGVSGLTGEDVLATVAYLRYPNCVYVDPYDNVFISDNGNQKIKEVNTSNIIFTVAGTGVAGWTGDGGPATNAKINSPAGMKGDEIGNLYICSAGDHRMRKVNSSGIISTICGTGSAGFGGDGSAATTAAISSPLDLAIDRPGNIYIADYGNSRVRIIESGVGVVSFVNGHHQSLNVCENSTANSISTLLAVNDTDHAHALTETWYLKYGPYNGAAYVTYTTTTTGSTLTPTGLYYIPNSNYSGLDSFQVWANNGYSVDSTTIVVNVKSFYAGLITPDPAIVCPGFTVPLHSDTTGGSWNSNSPFTASVSSSGVVTGLTAGNAIISYKITNSCGTAISRALVTVGDPTISTFAGTGIIGHGADGGAATATALDWPTNTVMDPSGNIYYTDYNSGYVRKITTTGNVYTVAGDGVLGSSGDGGAATAAEIFNPSGIALDASGNLFVTDYTSYNVRKITPSNIISTIAGTGVTGAGADGIPATTSQITRAWGVICDAAGNAYFSDRYNHKIKKVTPAGYIYTFAGTGASGFSGDGGPATAAKLNEPLGLAFDLAGNMYICDAANSRIRKVSVTGVISTICGNGTSGFGGDGGAATAISVEINTPTGITCDSAGNIYIDEWSGNRTRLINTSGIISTVAGTGVLGYNGDGIPATTATLNTIQGISIYGNGNMYICDEQNQRIRKVAPIAPVAPAAISGSSHLCQLSTLGLADAVAGGTWSSSNTSVATVSSLYGQVYGVNAGTTIISYSIAYPCGTLYTTKVITVNQYAPITGPTIVCPGNTISLSDAVGSGAWTSTNGSIATVAGGVVTGVGTGNVLISYTMSGGCKAYAYVEVGVPIITTIAGTGTVLGDGGAATAAQLNHASEVCLDASGNIYIADWQNNRIRKINTSGIITTIAGTGTAGALGDGGSATSAELNNPTAVFVDNTGNVYIGDYLNNKIRMINTSGFISTIAGTGTPGYSGDGAAATNALLHQPSGIYVDATGNVYFSDSWNSVIRVINTSSIISTYAGTGTGGFTGDNVPATTTQLNNPYGLTMDASGNLYIADQSNHRVRKVNASGIITTVAGSGIAGYIGDGSAATSARMDIPSGVLLDPAGDLIIADQLNSVVRKVNTSGIISTIAGTGTAGYAGDNGPPTAATLNRGSGVCIDPSGNIYIADSYNSVVREITTSTPSVAAITGSAPFCQGATLPLSDVTGGGIWSSANTSVASVGSNTGVVTGVGGGTTTITYTVLFPCGSLHALQTVTVNPLPSVSPITGTTTLCTGGVVTLSDVSGGGTWTSVNTSIATVGSTSGFVTGVAAGTDIISYTLSNSCGSNTVTTTVNVNAVSMSPITGTGSVCQGSKTVLSDATSGGAWSSSATGIATVSGGTVSGLVSGIASVSYTVSFSCGNVSAVQSVTVIATPAAISMAPSTTSTVCLTASSTFTATSTYQVPIVYQDFNNGMTGEVGGTWTVTNTGAVSPYNWAINAPAFYTDYLGYTGSALTGDGTNLMGSDPDLAGTGVNLITVLTSPHFSTVGYSAGTVAFNYYCYSQTPYDATVEIDYSIDGGTTWPVLTNYLNTRTGNQSWVDGIPTQTLALPPAAIGQPNVQVRWNYNSTWGYFWSVDNIVVSGVATPTYAWTGISSGAGGLSCNSCATTIITPTVTGTNIYSVTATGYGCSVTSGVAVQVNTVPVVAPIGGAPVICQGNTVSLNDATGSGAWSSSNTAVGTVGATTGIVGGVSAGTATISYTVSNTCGNTSALVTLTVNPTPAVISGAASVCNGATVTLSDSPPLGNWTSTNTAVAAIGATTGIITTVSVGTTIISYTLGTGCYATRTETVTNAPNPISGTPNVCVGSVTNLGDLPGGGTWSNSNNAVGTVNSSGAVTGVAAGTESITYSLGSGCISSIIVTVNPNPGAITGTNNICLGFTTFLTEGSGGGVWSSSNNAVGTVSTGTLTGVGVGTALISYTFGTGCNSTFAFTVNPQPGPITGSTTFCVGSTSLLSDGGLGNWSSSNGAVATIGATGIATGVGAGTAMITYTLGTGCLTTTLVTVNPVPAAITPPGAVSVCPGTATSLGDVTLLGSWSSSNPAVGTVSSSGTVGGISSGTVVISYTLATGCSVQKTVTVNIAPGPISPASPSVCVSASLGLTDGVGGGNWTSTNLSAATIGAISGSATGVSIGTTLITYAIGPCYVTAPLVVNGLLSSGSIIGPPVICSSTPVTFTDAAVGGVWVSSNTAVATVGATTGTVTGISAGTVIITYDVSNSCGSSDATTTVTVQVPGVAAIVGPSTICAGTFSNYTDATTGGGWSVSNSSASITGGGFLTAITPGTNIVSYSVTNACGTSSTTKTITIGAYLTAGSISGATSICAGANTTLIDLAPGGAWSAGNSHATVSGATVTGVSGGVDTISYTVSSSCGSASAIHVMTVIPIPVAGPITGSVNLCVGLPVTYTDVDPGGTWSLSNANATVNSTSGLVTPVATGTDILSYTVSNTCGSATATTTINIGPVLTAGSIFGPTAVCPGATISLFDATSGGVWTASNGNATVSGGVVTGVTAGTDIISYTVTAACGSTSAIYPITVNPLPNAGGITGPSALCIGSPVTYTESVSGGTWSVSNATATVSGSGLVSPVAAGTNILTYTVSNSCGSSIATQIINIGTSTPIGPITGPVGVCSGSNIILNDGVTGGTWISGSTSVATIGLSSGVVTGVSAGSTIITYTVTSSCGTASITTTISVSNSPVAGTISGPSAVCVGSFINLTDPATGGVWSSSNSNASVSGTGLVTGLVAGTDLISYTVSNFCGSASATQMVTVNPALTGAGITGSSAVCVGSGILLSDAVSGGTWTSVSTSVATVGLSSGVLLGIAPGTDIISYTINNSCGTTVVTTTITVNTPPNAGTITGPSQVCFGFSITLADAAIGGTWYSSNPLIATVGVSTGIVNGIIPGTATITYSVSNSCGTAVATKVIMVNSFPTVSSITGPSVVCTGVPITFTDAFGGGTWSSLNANATVGSSSGIVTGIAPGVDVISYTITNACSTAGTTISITINPSPDAGTITGPDSVCMGSSITLSDPAPGGVWSAGNANATVSGGIVTGVASGTDPISYTVSNSCGSVSAVAVISIDTLPVAGVIVGSSGVCVGAEITLTDAVPGGVWLKSNTNASIVSPGVILGVFPGIDSIFYSVTNGCGTAVASAIIAISAPPVIAPITGPTSQCLGSVMTVSDVTSGGTWSSGDISVASIGTSTGVVNGLSVGTVILSYTVVNSYGCAASAVAIDSVIVAPVVPAITGGAQVCLASNVTLSDAYTGGTWNSSNPSVAIVSGSGIVSGLSVGTTTISYTITTACGSSIASEVMEVTIFPTVSGIGGPTSVCAGATITLTNTVSGGVWSSAATSIATIGTGTGIVNGVSSGTDVINYTVTNACGTAAASISILVNPAPDPGVISGPSTVCTGADITLTETVSGGTWSAGNADATVSGGVVAGVSGGVDPISYSVTNSCGTASAIHTVVVNTYPLVDSVLGPTVVCPGASVTLTDATSGGTWSVTNGTAIVALGVVTGVTAGIDTIVYTVANSCASVSAIRIITINPLANPGTITGLANVCVGANITLTDAASGGTWSSSNASATVTSGLVHGVAAGTDTIYYSVTNSCGTQRASHTVAINALPDAGTISGLSGVCVGSSITLVDAAGGGIWSSSNATASVAGGIVTGLTAGTDTIAYTVTNACGTSVAKKTISVNTLAGAGTITGSSTVCVGATITLSDLITGGVWGSSGSKATVSGSGVVRGVATGTDTIRYTASNGCGSATTFKVITIISAPYAGSISGSKSSVCPGATITLTDAAPGGAWSSGNSSIATVSGGVVTGVTAGTDNISYSVSNSCGTVSAIFSVTVLSTDECNTGTGVSGVNKGNAELKVYPNPNNGSFTLNLLSDIDEEAQVTITNVLGEKIKELTMHTNKEVEVSLTQASGIYLISVTSESGKYMAKITVE